MGISYKQPLRSARGPAGWFNFAVSPWLEFYSQWMDLFFFREDQSMRRYIRHPSDIPISFSVGASANDTVRLPRLRDVSLGGLCFSSDSPLQSGAPIHIEIPVNDEDFVADGVIAWCRKEGDKYSVGVRFRDQPTQFSIRMVEQICHIEHYRAEVQRTEGRMLTSEEAAKEWIEKYAADFPG